MKKILYLLFLLGITFPTMGQEYQHVCAKSKISYFERNLNFQDKGVHSLASFAYDLKYHRLVFNIDPGVRYIKGSVTSYFEPKTSNFNEIAFEISEELIVDSIKMNNQLLSFSLVNELVLITLDNTIPENQLDSLTIFYEGVPTSSGFGSFETTSHAGVPVMWTLSEPYGAMEWWPCKQSLNDKIDSVDIFIKTPAIYRAASNGVLLSETVDIHNIKTAHWKHRHPIAAYLIAITVTNFVEYSDYALLAADDSVQILNYVWPETLGEAEISTPNIIDVMQLFSNLFIPYPYKDEKYGHAEFGWGGGMEHQTMSFMGGFSHSLMAHELAHQWFGDYVTCSSWRDIWLNEGFATYLEGLTTEHGLNSDGQSFKDWKSFKTYVATYSPTGSVYVDDTTPVNRIFSSQLSYSKGSMVLHTLRKQIGDEAFFNGIKNYLQDASLKNNYASTPDLQQHLEATSGTDLQYLFDDWVYGEGYPTYTIFHSQNAQGMVNLEINQTTSHSSVAFYKLKVPIEFKGITEDTTIIFDNTVSGQTFNFNLDFDIYEVVFDPEKDIINRNSQVLFIKNPEFESQITLRPNPANEQINLQLPDNIQFTDISLYNNLGQKITCLDCDINKRAYSYNISHLSEGIYYLKFSANGSTVTKKFVKQ